MAPLDPQKTCAVLHGKLGDYIYRHYPAQSTQKVPAYVPTNPQTPAQQAWRQVFADGIAAWKALSAEAKAEWWRKAKKKQMCGPHLFQRQYLNSHK